MLSFHRLMPAQDEPSQSTAAVADIIMTNKAKMDANLNTTHRITANPIDSWKVTVVCRRR
jgi:hypothetical protein